MVSYNKKFLRWFFFGLKDNIIEKKKKIEKSKKISLKPIKKTSKKIVKVDFTKIEGIGPKIQTVLRKNKIYTYKDLENSKIENIKKILNKNSLQRHIPDTWPKQAKMAREGRWKELEKWQDELFGGRKR